MNRIFFGATGIPSVRGVAQNGVHENTQETAAPDR